MDKNKRNSRFQVLNHDILKHILSLPKEEGLKIMERVNHKLHLEKERILAQAIKKGLFTNEEYISNYEHRFYDDFGSDSFMQYLDAAMNAKNIDFFLTTNERILKARDDLTKKFGLKIISPQELDDKK